MRAINLDNNATTTLLPEVAAAIAQCVAEEYGNPSSGHQLGRRTRAVLESKREDITRILGGEPAGRTPDRLVFTSGGTEANNLAMLGIRSPRSTAPSSANPLPETIVLSAIEHSSVVAPAEFLERQGFHLERLRVQSTGVVDESHLASLIVAAKTGEIPPIRMVAVMFGNNETGVIQPIEKLAAICREENIPLHVDAIQAAGKIPTPFRDYHIASMSVSSHKINGPRGIGALLVRGDVALEPRLYGGFQQEGLRPGTESIELAVGLWAALDAWQENRDQRSHHLRTLRDQFEAGLRASIPTSVVNGAMSERLPHTSNVAFPGIDRQAMFMALDQAGVLCSTGSACASGSSKPSPTLLAMGVPEKIVASSLRFSLGLQNTTAEVAEAVRRIADACRRLT